MKRCTQGPSCPNHAVAARLLREEVAEKHGSSECLARAQQARSAAATAARTDPAPVATVDLFAHMQQAMQQKQQQDRAKGALQRAEQRLQELRVAEAVAVRARQAAEKEVEALRSEAASQGLGKKRQKTAGATSEEQEGRPPNIEHYIDYDLEAWRRTTGQLMWRRAKPISAAAEAPLPRNGVDGALFHWRRGLVGALQDWANGSKANIVWLLLRLMEHFDVKEEMHVQLIGVVRINAPCITSISPSHCVLS